jgi:hypothetical protein
MSSQCNSIAAFRGLEPGAQCYITQSLYHLTTLALFIIGSLGAAGVFPGSMIGWVTVGLASGAFVFSLTSGNCGKRIPDLIVSGLITAVLVTVGALGSAGVLSTTQVGWGVVGTLSISTPISKCIGGCRWLMKSNK